MAKKTTEKKAPAKSTPAKKAPAKKVEEPKKKGGRKVAVEVETSVKAPPKKDKVVAAEKVKEPSAAEKAVLKFMERLGKLAKEEMETRLKALNNAYVKALKAEEDTSEIRYESAALRRLLGFNTYIRVR